MHSLGKAAVLALGMSATSYGLQATILADTNRDGSVDITGNTDVQDKAVWTEERGALFLPNIADTNRRCSSKINANTSNEELDKCHDASDNILRNPKYLAPLRILPNRNLTDSATGVITVSGKFATEKVRVFHKNGSNWNHIADKTVFRADALRTGLELGIDARDVRRPNEWDGRVTINFNVTDNGETASDQVALRVAPILTHHTLQAPDQVFTVAGMGRPAQAQFAAFIKTFTRQAGVSKPVHMFQEMDVWAQDYFEPGYASIPGPQGPISLRVFIRSSQPDRSAGKRAFWELRSDTVGAVQFFRSSNAPNPPRTIDSMGNLETIPPYSYRGKHYTAGRAVMGRHDNLTPNIMTFLKAQEAQYPIDDLDHTWLIVGHTDEYMQFLPANNSRGWIMTVGDPIAGMNLLKKAKADGHGKVLAMPRNHQSYDPENCLPSNTIDSVLGLPNFDRINQHCANRIKHNLDIIKRETGITDEEIIRVPSVFYTAFQGFDCSRLPKRSVGGRSSESPTKNIIEAAGDDMSANTINKRGELDGNLAFYPGTINGVVYENRQYLAPNPWGPIIGGQDIMAKAVSEAYAKAGFNVTYMDDWFDHHILAGETHCGSNVARDISQKWW
ncbi:protein-arginine deiminase [Pochonia chlamydosporia 170]|uniref:Protein-arginine deiminase n=1 Tax=Pochonia chlamydosporia 170 TaxID=1380566 RepID=A0A179G2F9_METCM|nr:protein-arginine deiminase [Pochonia chlamydosporia 170]OAQ72042.1 protein-arginine deiminase [Pochonia chlamydosporia 170]